MAQLVDFDPRRTKIIIIQKGIKCSAEVYQGIEQ